MRAAFFCRGSPTIALQTGSIVIFTAFYSTGEMRDINTGYIKRKNGPTDALQAITKADVDVELVQAHVAQLMIAATPAAERRELASIAEYRSRFNQFIDGATSEYPAEQAELSSVSRAPSSKQPTRRGPDRI